MPIAKRLYPILLGEKGDLDAVETDNTIRNAWTAVFALQEDVTLMQESVAGAIRRGEIAENDEAASITKVAGAIHTTVSSAPVTITGAKLVNPLVGRLPVINAALELEGGTSAPEYNLSTKTLTIRGALNITGKITGLGALAITGATTLSSTLAVTGTTTLDGIQIIDITNAEALLVRANSDGGDVFAVNTSTPGAILNGTLLIDGKANSLQLTVQGHTSQSTSVFRVENSSSTNIFDVGEALIASTQKTLITLSAADAFLVEDGSNVDVFAVNTATPGVTLTGVLTVSGTSLLSGTTTTFGRIKTVTRKTTTYTILVTDSVIFCNTDSAAFTATLPAGVSGQTFTVINSGSSGKLLTVAPNGSEHLLGVNSNFVLFDAETLDLTYDSTDGWY